MASDPHNKPGNRGDNVVSLSRHEFVAEIEKKLAEARRFFSLRQYPACQEVALQVLAADPNNSKAKALVDLLSIKLSRRKLYRKLIDPQETAPQTATESAGVRTSPASDAASPSSAQSPAEDQPPVEGPLLDSAPRKRRSRIPSPAYADATDTMRERTISALVELLREKDKTPADWRSQESADFDSTVASPRPGRAKEASKQRGPAPATLPPQASDFLPGSLDDLFVSTPVEAAPLRDEAKTPSATGPEATAANELPRAKATEPPLHPSKTKSPLPAKQMAPKPERAESRKTRARSEVNRSVPVKDTADGPGSSAALPTSAPLKVVQLPDVHLFEQITKPRKADYRQEINKKIERRSKEIENSEIKAASVAHIKRHLYQEEYDLCAQELERIRILFPTNAEIQAFVANTSQRLAELQRAKAFEAQAKDLMASSVTLYQEGKLEEALIAVREILRVNPHHAQAREFVAFVERRRSQETKRAPRLQPDRYCLACGTVMDDVSVFCFHCGKRLN